MPGCLELLKMRRSVRDYEERDVPLEVVLELIRESCLAPSSGNGQPWKFIVVTDREVIRILSDESKKNLLADIERDPDSSNKTYETLLRDEDFSLFYNAPCLVLIGGYKAVRTLHIDCALAACYFMFAACERGLGTCWIGLGRFIHDPGLRAITGMPDDYEIVAPIVLGYPKAGPPELVRRAPQILKVVS